MAATVFVIGLAAPVLAVSLFGDERAATSEGSIALAPLPPSKLIAPLNNETLETTDLLAGDVPEGVNPTERLVIADAPGAADQMPPGSKRIDIPQAAAGLPKAPIPGLTRESAFGPVPSKSAGSALNAYRRPFARQAGKQPVSIIVGGLGVNRGLTQDAIETLPADVTLSFAAHSIGLQEWVDAARADGHEVLIEIPMESANFDLAEPGADKALRVTVPPAENGRRLDWMMARAQGYAGLINFNGELFLNRTDAAATYMDRLSKTGVGFFTDGDFATPTLPSLARSMRQPFKTGHGLIDPEPIPRIISARLNGLSQTARSGSHPVGVGFVYSETISEVQAWIATLDGQNLQLAPATSALN
jgi:polysaccharide deacetylase 2 family uncharacterized protein YibQ